ncbi:MAG: YceK/YidQ family lipoprotein [bacterium]
MKMKLMIIALALAQCGCASIISLKRTPRTDIHQGDQAYARKIYGGVRTDWHEANSWIPGPSWAWPVGIVIFLDLPFSATVDTVALPFTIPYNLMKSETTASNQAAQATAPKVADPGR